MAFSDFTLDELKTRFGLTIREDASLFPAVAPIGISSALAALLEDNIPLALAIDTEKGRSEFMIAPVLAALRKSLKDRISLFSGVEFVVDPEQGLSGVCDFLLSRSPEQLYVSAPVAVLVEAKNNRIKEGIPQCIAEMVAARIFNERRGNVIPVIHGTVTTGSLWRFLQLEGNQVSVDREEYHIHEIGKIFAVLHHIAILGQP